MSFSGIEYLGKHSFHDLGVTIASRSIGLPDKQKIKISVPFSNHEIDFSEIYGDQIYGSRELVYQFNIIGQRITEKVQMNVLKTRMVNWLMNSRGQQKLYDDFFTGYYFLAEAEEGPSFEENWIDGTLDVSFVAYPFMISERSEGHDIWDEFNFELDVSQKTTAKSSMGTFKELAIGSFATIGAYATFYDGWTSISHSRLGVSRKILSKQATTQGNSNWAYELEGVEGFVLEQDIVQSRVNPTKITLINAGTPAVIPKVTTNNKISVVKGNAIYNFWPGVTQDEVFSLESGENELTITSVYNTDISFEFYKELI